MNKKRMKTMKGFTLMEMVVSMGVFAVMATVISGSFASGFSSYRGARERQRDVESAQYAVNTMAKNLRTSTIVSSAGAGVQSVRFYDYSSSRCFEYRFYSASGTASELQARWKSASDPTDLNGSKSECASAVFLTGGFKSMTSGYVTGKFNVVPSSDGSASAKKVGRISVFIAVKEKSAAAFSSDMQTTVSLRDYSNAGY